MIIIIAILGIILAIAVPRVTIYIEKSKIAADMETVEALNSVTPLYRATSSSDPFMDLSKTNIELIEVLLNTGFLSSIVEPQNEDASFIWDFENQKWIYSISY
ncbi:MAG: hypothetical protein JXQ26_02725 [Tissierellales bacterium]|nr:hypothetical protein [Tissierellales bacterium]